MGEDSRTSPPVRERCQAAPTSPELSGRTRFKIRPGPAGVHLFDRATGANLLVDEYVVPKEQWALAPRNISVAVTNACDLRCSYCYAPKNVAAAKVALLETWLAELDALGCLGVGFGGGEPTLWQDLPRICSYLATKTALAVTLTTHGHRFDEDLADRLRGNVHFVRVSMDGVGRTYEALRGRSFLDFRRRIATIRATARFGINLVVNQRTLPDLPEAAAFAANEGAVELLLLPEQPVRGRGGIDLETRKRLTEWVRTSGGRIRLATSQAAGCELPTCDPLVLEQGLRAYAHVDASGTLKRSSYDVSGVPIGDGDVATAIKRLGSLSEEVT